LNKRKVIEEQAQNRRLKLGDSAQYFQFDREVEETKAWLDEKTKIAADESYKVFFFFFSFLLAGVIMEFNVRYNLFYRNNNCKGNGPINGQTIFLLVCL